jgi:biopolymer transport protein ExbB/TolQ
MDTYFAMRAARRQADASQWEHRDGLSSLASVASVAAFVGLIGSCWAIVDAIMMPPAYGDFFTVKVSAKVVGVLVWNALGLAIAVVATAGYRYLSERCDELAVETELVLLELPDALQRLGGSAERPVAPELTALDWAARAADRTRRSVLTELGARFNGLATVARVAPFVGLMGTCLWISCHTFKGSVGSRSGRLGMVANGLTESLLFNAWGLAIALFAMWLLHYASENRDRLDHEMRRAIDDLRLALRSR